MLPPYIRFQVQNSTGVAFGATDTLSLTGKYLQVLTATGVLSATAQVTPLASTSGNSLASGGFATSAGIDTTNLGGGGAGTTLGIQGDFLLEASISTATPNGNLNVFMQESPDGGTTWPANGVGTLIGVMYCTATGAQGNVMCSAR